MPFTSVPPQGYFLEITDSSGPFDHSLGGTHKLRKADCPTCKRPFLLMMSLDVRDPKLGLQLPGQQALPLLYCWSCGPNMDYQIQSDGRVKLIDPDEDGWAGSCFPYEPYPKSFPRKSLRLEPVPSGIQDMIRKHNAGKLDDRGQVPEEWSRHLAPRHQVGGEAYFVQRNCVEGGWECASCGKDAPFLASVADEAGDGRRFHKNSFLQVVFHYCQDCRVVNAYHECD